MKIRASVGTMIEGEDFYFDKGKMVFTEKYLLKKGKCCHHKCRHCPWKKLTKCERNGKVNDNI